jgi:hypothetical protein
MPATPGDLPPELRDTFWMLRGAYPTGIPKEDYEPLLSLLYEGMSFRTLATTLAHCTGKDYLEVLNDAYGAATPEALSPEGRERLDGVRERLQAQSYDLWLRNALYDSSGDFR